MIQENDFDAVHDCQAVFRFLLHAIANPGEIVCIRPQAEKLRDNDRVMTALALTLLDKETCFAAPDDPAFAKKVSELTYAGQAAEKADFIFITQAVSRATTADIFAAATPGTLVEPHTNSVLFIGIEQFTEASACRLTGPGIKDTKSVGLPEYAKQWVRERDTMDYEYPTGVDLYFVTPAGELMALPRKVKMEG